MSANDYYGKNEQHAQQPPQGGYYPPPQGMRPFAFSWEFNVLGPIGVSLFALEREELGRNDGFECIALFGPDCVVDVAGIAGQSIRS